jgi:hypothetical protein
MWAHDYSQPPIGVAEKLGFKIVDGKKKLVYRPVLHRKTPMSNYIADLVDAGIIKASSVGFKPLDMDENRYTKTELLEISLVGVPANQNALALGLSKGYGMDVIKSVRPDIEEKNEEAEVEKEVEVVEADSTKEILEKLDSIKEDQEKLANDMREYLTSQSSEKGVQGREPAPSFKKRDAVRTSLKVMNKSMELLNKILKEK